jgi:MFS family permease
VATLGWLFDTMDQQLFNLARVSAVRTLLGVTPADTSRAGQISEIAGYSTTIFMIGWALGGILFGALGDKLGRARTMLMTVLTYSAFTGLSGLAVGVIDFCVYRFLTGLGVGGQFAVGVALVAETMPDRSRPYALGMLQALSAVGNMLAALTSMLLGRLEESGAVGQAWRAMFFIGLAPAVLAIPIMTRLREPEKWVEAVKARQPTTRRGFLADLFHTIFDPIAELFADPRWRPHALVGLVLALAGVVGLWGIGFFSFDLIDTVMRPHFERQGLSPQEVNGRLTFWKGITSLVQNAGAFFGVYSFALVAQRTGRRPAFAIAFVLAAAATFIVFWQLQAFWQIFVLIPIMGFCQLAIFGGYAIYFPELFPTRLRSTGTSVCYNVGRLIAAAGPTMLGLLTSRVYAAAGPERAIRYAGMTMCAVFLVGLLALPFAPETKGKPLPE